MNFFSRINGKNSDGWENVIFETGSHK